MKLRISMVLLVVGVFALATLPVVAQGQGQRQGRGQGFGGRQMGGMGSIARLLMVEEVQKELKVTEDQVAKVREAMDAMRPAGGPGQGQGARGNFSEMTEEERAEMRAQMQQRMQERNNQIKEALGKVLSGDQMKRLNEISLQQQGVMALADPDVATALALKEEQKTKIADVLSSFRQNARPARDAGDGPADRQALRQQMQERREQLNKDLMAVLTTDQQGKWKEMQGAPFEMPQGAMFGGAGRGGRGQNN
jgi:hypothetical protein